jgi:uncharacterized protein YdhG (YjbR/CyaY superfamily)
MNMFKPTKAKTPAEYIAALPEPRRTEVKKLDALIRKTVPKMKPYIELGMLGYGTFHYKYASGREGDWALIGLASRAQYISLYICAADGKQYLAEKYKKDLPKASIGKSCIRFKKVEDLDLTVIKKMLREAEAWLKAQK